MDMLLRNRRITFYAFCVCLAVAVLGTILSHDTEEAMVPVRQDVVFTHPASGEVLVQGESYRIEWQGAHPNTLSLRLVSTEDESGHGVIISKHLESFEGENSQAWDIPCGPFTAPGSYMLFFEDEATGEYVFPSEIFSIRGDPACSNSL